MQTLISSEEAIHSENYALHTQSVERVIQIMHSHMHESLTLEDLASTAYLSPSHFHRVFCHVTGVPPGEFLTAMRFHKARNLLLSTSLSVTDICFEVGYTSTGSFTTRFTHLVGASPRLIRQRAYRFEPVSPTSIEDNLSRGRDIPTTHTLRGSIIGPTTFHGIIYIGLFAGPIPQGLPVKCTHICSTGGYLIHNIPDGVYHLRAAAFPEASDILSCVLPGKMLLVGNNMRPLTIQNGCVFGETDLVLHSPRVTDPPLVMGLPLL